jgi:PAS domain S-box-containing protein
MTIEARTRTMKMEKLRQPAGLLLDESDEALKRMSPQEISNLIHELRVHQRELKIQNDELRRIQLELENAKDRYVSLFDFAPIAYFTLNDMGVITQANLTAATILDWPRAALVGQMFSRFIHREDQDVWYLHCKRLLGTGDSQSFQLRMVKNDGGKFYVNIECLLTKDCPEELKAIRIVAVDTTELRRSEEALRQANITLEQIVSERTYKVGQQNVQLQKLALELSSVEDRERQRLAMILHDDLQQRLVSLRFKIWDIVPKDRVDKHVEKNIADFEKDIAESITISRALSIDLSPPVLYKHGLTAALTWLAKDNETRHGLFVKLNLEKEAEPENAALASVLFRTVKELLFNIVKHADVRSAHLETRLEDNMILIRVMDTGKGFDVSAFQAGEMTNEKFGLFSIGERIHIFGGKIRIDSEPGKGCRVNISITKSFPSDGLRG